MDEKEMLNAALQYGLNSAKDEDLESIFGEGFNNLMLNYMEFSFELQNGQTPSEELTDKTIEALEMLVSTYSTMLEAVKAFKEETYGEN